MQECKYASILSRNIFDPNLTWPKLFQTERTRRLAHLPSFCGLVLLNQLHPSRHSSTLLQASSNSTSGVSDWDPSRWSIQIHLAGAVLGGLLSALLGSTIGRKSSLLASTLPDTMGWLLMAATYLAPPSASLPLLLTGRALTGLASAGRTSWSIAGLRNI